MATEIAKELSGSLSAFTDAFLSLSPFSISLSALLLSPPAFHALSPSVAILSAIHFLSLVSQRGFRRSRVTALLICRSCRHKRERNNCSVVGNDQRIHYSQALLNEHSFILQLTILRRHHGFAYKIYSFFSAIYSILGRFAVKPVRQNFYPFSHLSFYSALCCRYVCTFTV